MGMASSQRTDSKHQQHGEGHQTWICCPKLSTQGAPAEKQTPDVHACWQAGHPVSSGLKSSHAGCKCRMAAVPALLQDQSLEDPLDSPEQLHDQLESLSYLYRFQYEQFSKYLCGLMDPILKTYTQALSSPGKPLSAFLSDAASCKKQTLLSKPLPSACTAALCFKLAVHVHAFMHRASQISSGHGSPDKSKANAHRV